MNDQTLVLIEKLAVKLGTTSEYLWGIMLRKARLAVITDLLQYGLVILACIGCYYLWKFAVRKVNGDDNWDFEFYWIPGIISGVLLLFLIAIFFSFPNTFYALFDPEVWVLTEILNKIK